MSILDWFISPKPRAISGISGAAWDVSAPNDFKKVLFGFLKLFPEHSMLYVEGTLFVEIAEVLRVNQTNPTEVVSRDTFWPKTDVYHMELTDAHVHALSSVVDKLACEKICFHMKVYRGATMLMEWHDADLCNDILISKDISEDLIKSFCNELGVKYAAVRF